ncbi:MAG: sulfotransferase [Maribacter sp.]|nr:sulfotransferase [Candidatus Brocadiaceae bacterium]MCP4975431.1 sulfotransferase [Maribacter sp.]
MESLVYKYSVTEKSLHNLAFKSCSFLVSLSNIESRIFKKKLGDIEIKKPVFITALPRAGTTLLLELCVGTNEFVSHTYRDMPFLFTPLFWNRFSKLFKHSDVLRERAHGDGMMIRLDSPEAFEEIIWNNFWPSRYGKDRIVPWTDPVYPDFEKFLHEHLRKIILLRGKSVLPPARYISKNNLNIARIGYLKRVFPDAIIVVPFRDPLQHALSLLRQNRNFLKIHEEDSFACKYMRDIGHYDFGKNLRPVDFDTWFSSEQVEDHDTLLFWLQYWISTYRYLLKNECGHIKFFSYDAFCKDPGRNLEQFGELLEIKNIETLIGNASRIAAPKPYAVDTNGIPSDILNQAKTLYMDLENFGSTMPS